MPFFIPIMIAASVASMLPSFIPKENKRADQVIAQDGNNYFNRQSMRNGNNSFNHQMPTPSQRNPYPQTNSTAIPESGIIQKAVLYGGIAIIAIIALRFLLRRN